jgi:GNAT superfamily N-acetyltransferase
MDGSDSIRITTACAPAAFRELYQQHYWRPRCLLLDDEFYAWQMRQPPLSRALGGDQSLAAVDETGQLLAHLALFPSPVWDHGRDRTGIHLISWLAAPQARGQGVGPALMQRATELADVLAGRSLSPPSRAVLRRLGFRYLTRCQRWVGVLDPAACAPLLIDPPAHAEKVLLRQAWPTRVPPPFTTSRQPPAGVEDLARQALQHAWAFARTRDMLTWRYQQHPRLRYDFLWLGDGSRPRGVAITRTETILGRPGRALRICEFLTSADAAVDLAHAVAAWGRQQGCAFMDLFGLSEQFVAGFVAAGGWNTWEEPELRLPTLLSPWDPDDTPPGVVMFSRADPRTGIALTDNLAECYWSKGDGNMDWPSWAAQSQAA